VVPANTGTSVVITVLAAQAHPVVIVPATPQATLLLATDWDLADPSRRR